jgi:hypothetical protein
MQDFDSAYVGSGSHNPNPSFDARISTSASCGHACRIGLGRLVPWRFSYAGRRSAWLRLRAAGIRKPSQDRTFEDPQSSPRDRLNAVSRAATPKTQPSGRPAARATRRRPPSAPARTSP